MSDLEEGDYNLQNVEFLVVLGETTRKTSTSEANADKLPQHSEMAGLPRQISVSPTGFEPPTVSPYIRSSLSTIAPLTGPSVSIIPSSTSSSASQMGCTRLASMEKA